MDYQERQDLIVGTKDKIEQLTFKMKPNPHNWPIIDKWNRREYDKIKYKVFDAIEATVDKIIQAELPKKFSEFVNVKDIHLVDGALQTRLEIYDFQNEEGTK